jgi:hypothetical protein
MQATLILFTTSAHAAPVAQPGDIGLRHDIQVLADYGAISGPVTTWPISWDAVIADLEFVLANDIVLPNKVLPTFNRVLARAQGQTARGQVAFGGSLSGAEEPVNIRGFADTPRARGELEAGVSWFSEHISLDLNVSAVDRPMARTCARTGVSLVSTLATGRSRRAPWIAGGVRAGTAV